MSQSDAIHPRVEKIIADFLAASIGWDDPVEGDMSLIDGGLIDSLSIVQIVQSLQETFDIEIGVSDMVIDNFDTVDAITTFIEGKLA